MAAPGSGIGHFERGLVDQADSMLSSLGYFLSVPAREMLANLVVAAVQKMRAGGEPPPTDFERVRTSISTLVDELSKQAKVRQERQVEEARQRGVYEQELLTVRTIDITLLESAMSGLCPGFWPFC